MSCPESGDATELSREIIPECEIIQSIIFGCGCGERLGYFRINDAYRGNQRGQDEVQLVHGIIR
jgi:hypothetical protein